MCSSSPNSRRRLLAADREQLNSAIAGQNSARQASGHGGGYDCRSLSSPPAYSGHEVKTIEDAYRLLDQGEVQAIVYDAPVLLYRSLTTGKGKEQVVGPIFQEEGYAIALPTGSPLREPINGILLRLRQNGAYDELYQRWFGSQSKRDTEFLRKTRCLP